MTHAEEDGFHACNDGLALSDNPYGDPEQAAEWRRGWLAAEKAQDDANVEVQFREPRR